MAESWHTVDDIAETLKVHPQTVRKLIRSGELPASRIGERGGWRVSETDLLAFMAERKSRPNAAETRRRSDDTARVLKRMGQ